MTLPFSKFLRKLYNKLSSRHFLGRWALVCPNFWLKIFTMHRDMPYCIKVWMWFAFSDYSVFGMYFYSIQRKIKLKNKNELHGVVPVCERFFLLQYCHIVPRCQVVICHCKRLKMLPEMKVHVELVWICMQGDYGLIGRKWRVWSVFHNAPWAHASDLTYFSTTNQRHSKTSFWGRATVVNCVRIKTSFKKSNSILCWSSNVKSASGKYH